MAEKVSEQQRRECDGVLEMFSTDTPLIVHPAFFRLMKDAGLRMEGVVEQKPLLMWGQDD